MSLSDSPLILPASDLVAYAHDPIDWVVDGLVPAGSLIIVAGLPKVARKTITMIKMGLCVARGQDFLDRHVPKGRPVIYSYLEDGVKRAGRRMRAFGVRESDIDLKFIASIGQEGMSSVREKILKSPVPGLWIIDPLVELAAMMGHTDENDAIQMAKCLRSFRDIAQESNWAVVIVHHFRKAGDEMRGSVALGGACDGWLYIHKRGDQTEIVPTLRDDDSKPIGVRFEHAIVGGEDMFNLESMNPDELPPRQNTSEQQGPRRGPKKESILRLLTTLATPPIKKYSKTELTDLTGLNYRTLQNCLEKLEADGTVSGVGGWHVVVPNGN